jgi:putative transposase
MPRQPRLILSDLPIHVIQRGNNRLTCFQGETDYLVVALLLHGSRKFACAMHAYCLMSNHVHLLMTPSTPEGCGAFMHAVSQRYAHYYNRRYQRTGTLWEGRFRSCVVESSRYLLACYRYIELNPVRAGLVSEARKYRWSSHLANMSACTDPLVTAHAEFLALDRATYELSARLPARKRIESGQAAREKSRGNR